MENSKLINSLRSRISEYKSTELYKNKALKQDILSIEIALCLFELSIDCKRKITEEENYWFKGAFYIDNDITGEWQDISNMYNDLVELQKRLSD
jgi:hypothetical protein